jgi:hypothetical protein
MGAEMRKLLITTALALAVAFSALAQNSAPADLSGTWVLNLAKSKLSTFTKIESQTAVVICSRSTVEFNLGNERLRNTSGFQFD